MDTLDIALRLGTATLVGVVLGLNRDLHGKVTGVRTLGLVCLGSALAVLSVHAVNGTDASRVIQGIVTGVGFLGAGVIVRNNKDRHVHGLTTAACVSVRLADAPSGRSLPWVLHSFSSFWFLADRSRNQLTGAGRARNRVTSRSRRSTKRGCLARCLAHTTDASSNRISARFVRSWQSPLSNFSLDR